MIGVHRGGAFTPTLASRVQMCIPFQRWTDRLPVSSDGIWADGCPSPVHSLMGPPDNHHYFPRLFSACIVLSTALSQRTMPFPVATSHTLCRARHALPCAPLWHPPPQYLPLDLRLVQLPSGSYSLHGSLHPGGSVLVSARLREGVSATCAPVFGRGSYEHFEFFDFKPKTFSRPLTVGSVAWVVWALGTYAVLVPGT